MVDRKGAWKTVVNLMFIGGVAAGAAACTPPGEYQSPLENLKELNPSLVPPSLRDGSEPPPPPGTEEPTPAKDSETTDPPDTSTKILTQSDIENLNNYDHIIKPASVRDPLVEGAECVIAGEVGLATNADAYILTVSLGGRNYGPSGPIRITNRLNQIIAQFDPQTQPVPDNVIGLPHGEITVCATDPY